MKPAAIAAQLVDVRNVGTHKVVKLTIHVPEEQAALVIDAFGWPTMTNPLPVAIARLNPGAEPGNATRPPSADMAGQHERIGLPTNSGPSPNACEKPARIRTEAQRAGYLCTLKTFQRFLDEGGYTSETSEDAAKEAVLHWCGVNSRSTIDTEPNALARWRDMLADFDLWQRALV